MGNIYGAWCLVEKCMKKKNKGKNDQNQVLSFWSDVGSIKAYSVLVSFKGKRKNCGIWRDYKPLGTKYIIN